MDIERNKEKTRSVNNEDFKVRENSSERLRNHDYNVDKDKIRIRDRGDRDRNGDRDRYRNRDRSYDRNHERRGGDGYRREEENKPNRVFVGNLSFKTNWQSLKDHMKQAGEVVRADIFLNKENRSKGCG